MSSDNNLVVVGSIALDTVETPFGKVKEALGGSATYFSMAARHFTSVRLVACVGKDFPKQHVSSLKHKGIDVTGLEIKPGKTFRWKGRYGYDLNTAQTLKTELNVLASFDPQIPESYRRSATVFLANIDPVIQGRVLDQVRAPRLVCADTMNYWIENKRKALWKILKRVDIFLCNEAEARELASETNLITCARTLLNLGPKIIVVKKGEHGVVLFSHAWRFWAPAFLTESPRDPTGAGDSFAGGFMGFLARSRRLTLADLKKAVVYGSVIASYNVEDFSLRRLARLTRSDIDRRFHAFRALTRF